MARETLSIPDMSGASYANSQVLASGEVDGTFTKGDTLTTKSWVQADDTTHNLLITEITNTGQAAHSATITLGPGLHNSYPNAVGSTGSVLTVDVQADAVAQVDGINTNQVRVAVTVVGATASISNNALSFSLSPGSTAMVVSSVMSNYDDPNYQTTSVGTVHGLTPSSVDTLYASHSAWWSSFLVQLLCRDSRQDRRGVLVWVPVLDGQRLSHGRGGPRPVGQLGHRHPRLVRRLSLELQLRDPVPVHHPGEPPGADGQLRQGAHRLDGPRGAKRCGRRIQRSLLRGPDRAMPTEAPSRRPHGTRYFASYGNNGAFMGQKSDARCAPRLYR